MGKQLVIQTENVEDIYSKLGPAKNSTLLPETDFKEAMTRLQSLLLLATVILAPLALAKQEQEVIEHESGLVVKIVKKSKSCLKTAKNGDELHVQYVGRLTNAKGKI